MLLEGEKLKDPVTLTASSNDMFNGNDGSAFSTTKLPTQESAGCERERERERG